MLRGEWTMVLYHLYSVTLSGRLWGARPRLSRLARLISLHHVHRSYIYS